MSHSSAEALHRARQLCRTLASAPVPQARSREIFSILVRAEGWSSEQERAVIAFGDWLDARPPPGAMKTKCEELLTSLAPLARRGAG